MDIFLQLDNVQNGLFNSERTCYFKDIDGKNYQVVTDMSNVRKLPYEEFSSLKVALLQKDKQFSVVRLPDDPFDGHANIAVSNTMLIRECAPTTKDTD